ncbi:MAG: hypothetical protein Q4A74_09060 [Cardiobacteriaceae bacterium]|nr:hypothetical protein [Cardiobacteriaceae bacterium]
MQRSQTVLKRGAPPLIVNNVALAVRYRDDAILPEVMGRLFGIYMMVRRDSFLVSEVSSLHASWWWRGWNK